MIGLEKMLWNNVSPTTLTRLHEIMSLKINNKIKIYQRDIRKFIPLIQKVWPSNQQTLQITAFDTVIQLQTDQIENLISDIRIINRAAFFNVRKTPIQNQNDFLLFLAGLCSILSLSALNQTFMISVKSYTAWILEKTEKMY
uniref:Uncharacterized protein n=1 Tax=Romanomermis culicivorax TaxID=13658 RepID=A0A915KER9_ROMCU